jgi:conserved oligomeric Golgi complex subunit 3
MLSRTTSLLPNSLFASLGMPRSDDTMTDAKHGIDTELKRACQAVIAYCAEPLGAPLRTFADAAPGASAAAAEQVDVGFRVACQRDLRAAAARLRLYLADQRTVDVLLQHVRERLEDDYAVFRDVVWGKGIASGEGVLSSEGLREMLREVCEELDVS